MLAPAGILREPFLQFLYICFWFFFFIFLHVLYVLIFYIVISSYSHTGANCTPGITGCPRGPRGGSLGAHGAHEACLWWARGCRAAHFSPWIRWQRGLLLGLAPSGSRAAEANGKAALPLLGKEENAGQATPPGDPPQATHPDDPLSWPALAAHPGDWRALTHLIIP